MRLQPACRKQFSKFAKTRQQTQRIHIGYANATESQVNSMIDWDSGLAVTAARIDTLVVPIAVSQQQNSEQTTSEKGKARSKKCAEFVCTGNWRHGRDGQHGRNGHRLSTCLGVFKSRQSHGFASVSGGRYGLAI